MQQGDLVGDVLRHEIERFRLDNFDSFELHVLIHPTTRAKPIIDADGNQIGFDEYDFDQWQVVHNITHTARQTSSRPPTPIKVGLSRSGPLIWYMKQWRPVSSFLQHLKPSAEWNDDGNSSTLKAMQLGWEQQARWWLANGKKFRLLDLPAELRNIIYGHVFGAVVKPYPTARARRLGPSTYNTLAKTPSFNLLQTCKLVHKEASHILFHFTPFFVEHIQILQKLTDSQSLRSSIRHLEIALSHDAFLGLFRQYVLLENGDAVADKSRAAMALKHMKLTRLRLTIAPPSTTTASGMFDGACQKAAVEWILDAAWPFVRGHLVELSGFVKTSQKAAFEAKCDATRTDFEMWQKENVDAGLAEGSLAEYLQEVDQDGGVIVDDEKRAKMEELEEANKGTTHDPQLLCCCKVPCTLSKWTADD